MINPDDLLPVSDDETPQESKLVISQPAGDGDAGDGESGDQLDSYEKLPEGASITISLLGYEKRGDGINAYLVYKISTYVDGLPGYSGSSYEVYRRFSDFLGLRAKLVEKYQVKGFLVPAAPEKSLSALTKTKLNSGNDDLVSNEVLDKRARELQRFLRRIARHPKLITDCDVRDFLTMETTLPKAAFTSALSGSNMKKIIKSFGDVFTKIVFPMDENDRWFEQVHSQVDEMDELVGRLQSSVDTLVSQRRELTTADEQLARALTMLASCEENTSLARILSKVGETHSQLAVVEKHMTEQDSAVLLEVVQEHMALTGVLKDVFYERVKAWQNWQAQQQALVKKREVKTRLELAGKTDRANQCRDELVECEQKADQMEKDFKAMSRVIRGEFARCSHQRSEDLTLALIEFFDVLIESESQVLEQWEKLLPETKLSV